MDDMHWDDGMHNGGGSVWWLFMALMMLAFLHERIARGEIDTSP